MKVPYIKVSREGDVDIVGEPEGLEQLGKLLIETAKTQKAVNTELADGVNGSIRVTSVVPFPSEIFVG